MYSGANHKWEQPQQAPIFMCVATYGFTGGKAWCYMCGTICLVFPPVQEFLDDCIQLIKSTFSLSSYLNTVPIRQVQFPQVNRAVRQVGNLSHESDPTILQFLWQGVSLAA